MASSARSSKALTAVELQRAARSLSRRDPKLGKWISRIGKVTLRRKRHQFDTLCNAIISQQVAKKAAATIYERFLTLFPAGRPDPASIKALSAAQLREQGVSAQKSRYLVSLSDAYLGGPLENVRLGTRSDQDIIDLLTQVSGIGVWTAEMFLIFSLGRPDVFSVGDLALRQGLQRVEERDDMSHAEIAEVAERWAPHRSVASLYLWKIAHWRDEG